MANKIQLRRDTAANWASANPVLAAGEPALETDTGKTKLGDGVATWNALPYKLDKATADTFYAPVSGSPNYAPYAGTATLRSIGNKWAFLGDSITNGSTTSAAANAYPQLVQVFAGRQVQNVVTAGVPGNTSAQMLARFDTDIAGKGANTLHLLAGTNDAGQGVPIATTAANVKAIVAKARALGMAVVLATIPPRGPGATAAINKATYTINLWLNRYAAAENLPLVDYFAALVDNTTGYYLTANNSGDDVHPNDNGHYLMAQTLANAAASARNGALSLPYPIVTNGDPVNLVPNPLIAGTVGAAGASNGWYFTGPATATTAVLANDSAILGQYYSVQMTAANGYKYLYNSIANNSVAPGDKVAYSFRWFTDQVTQPALADVSVKFSVNFTDTNGASPNNYLITNQSRPLSVSSPSWTELTVPANMTQAQLVFQLSTTATSTASARLKIAQVGLYNLTKLGLVGI